MEKSCCVWCSGEAPSSSTGPLGIYNTNPSHNYTPSSSTGPLGIYNTNPSHNYTCWSYLPLFSYGCGFRYGERITRFRICIYLSLRNFYLNAYHPYKMLHKTDFYRLNTDPKLSANTVFNLKKKLFSKQFLYKFYNIMYMLSSLRSPHVRMTARYPYCS
jgi:hypothetical protein